jgi:hypothetical protein|tara:strand:+ start:4934 stop:5725 length:792 start_codon:yes stop_codon:yes gene_type:complete
MVRFVKDQPDAYIYSSFGSRIFIGGFLLTLVFIYEAVSVYMYSEAASSLFLKMLPSSLAMIGKILAGIMFISAMFMPLIGMTTVISWLILKRTYKKLEKLGVNSRNSQTLLLLAKVVFIAAGLATYAPLFTMAEAMINGTIPITSLNYYQTTYMSLFFTLLGIGLFLTLISPIVQLYGRTKSRSLLFSGLLAFGVCSTIIYLGNGDWNISVFQLPESSEFRSSFATVMGTSAVCILIIFWTISRNAKSILKYQKLHFTMKLGE